MEEARHKQLRDLDCNALKFIGLSYTTEEIAKMDDEAFEVLRDRGAEFFQRRELSRSPLSPTLWASSIM